MSVEAVAWALTVPVGSNQKVVLIGLANHAHPDGSNTYPSLDKLAEYAACDRSTARRNVRKLLEGGWIIEDGNGPMGTVKYRLSMTEIEGVAERHRGVALAPEGGGSGAPEGVAPMPPEPPIEPSIEQRARAGEANSLPDAFPTELEQHALQAYTVLDALARAHHAKAITMRQIGMVIMARPRHPIVRAAHDCVAYFIERKPPRKDVVATYRNWLDRCDQLAATEPLPGDGNVVELTGYEATRRRRSAALSRLTGGDVA